MLRLITLDNLQRFKDVADTKYAAINHTHNGSDLISFNTAYDASTNKAATMSDITSATSGMLTSSSAIDATKVSGTLPVGTYTDTTYVFNTAYDASTNKAATMADINSAISSVYRYKGSVATYSALPTENLTSGDVYNIEAADSDNDILAGDNVAWNGTAWDRLAGSISIETAISSEIVDMFAEQGSE